MAGLHEPGVGLMKRLRKDTTPTSNIVATQPAQVIEPQAQVNEPVPDLDKL